MTTEPRPAPTPADPAAADPAAVDPAAATEPATSARLAPPTAALHVGPLPQFLNLLAPGVGLVLLGRPLLGTLVALLFSASATYALAALLLIPADVPPLLLGLSVGVAIGTYAGAQLRYAQTLREHARQFAQLARRAALRATQEALAAADPEGAWRAFQPLRDRVDHDLVVALRYAQVLDARGDRRAARRAWLRVRELDPHGLYRQDTRAALADAQPNQHDSNGYDARG